MLNAERAACAPLSRVWRWRAFYCYVKSTAKSLLINFLKLLLKLLPNDCPMKALVKYFCTNDILLG